MTTVPKPKLLLVADTYYPKVDGTLKFVEEFVKRAQDSFELSLLVPDLGQRHSNKTVDKVTYVQPSRFLQMSGYPSMKLSVHNFHRIKQAVQDADLIFIQGPALISYVSIYYAHRYHKKSIFYLHVISWELFAKFVPPLFSRLVQSITRKISIFFYNRCTLIIVPYLDLQHVLLHAGVNIPITVARLGVDIDLLTPPRSKRESKLQLQLDPGKLIIGYVGRISKEKNITTLFNAFCKLKEQQKVFLLMVGDGPAEQLEKFKSLPNCRVTGFVPNVQEYLQAMDIFVMPSLTETTSLATLEAMSCGLPVIATKVGFMRHYIVKGHNGFFFPRGSAAMLAAKLEKLITDAQLRETLGRNARRTIAHSFSWERSINKIKHILYRQNI